MSLELFNQLMKLLISSLNSLRSMKAPMSIAITKRPLPPLGTPSDCIRSRREP